MIRRRLPEYSTVYIGLGSPEAWEARKPGRPGSPGGLGSLGSLGSPEAWVGSLGSLGSQGSPLESPRRGRCPRTGCRTTGWSSGARVPDSGRAPELTNYYARARRSGDHARARHRLRLPCPVYYSVLGLPGFPGFLGFSASRETLGDHAELVRRLRLSACQLLWSRLPARRTWRSRHVLDTASLPCLSATPGPGKLREALDEGGLPRQTG